MPHALAAALLLCACLLVGGRMSDWRMQGWASPYTALDYLATLSTDDTPNAIETAGETFPGSAFFFAQGAFDPVPETAQASAHILPLRKVIAPASAPFTGHTPLDRYRALNCLTSAIYYEAANEPDEGQRAVAQVVLNRVRHPAWPGSVCAVVYQGSERADLLCQFTFSCDGAMARAPDIRKWARARRAAERALSGEIFAPVGYSTYYHTLAVRPDWSSKLNPVAVVGAHIFYEMRGINGTAAAFNMPYWRRELISGPAPRVWKPLPVGALPIAMPYMAEPLPFSYPASSGTHPAPDVNPAQQGWTPPETPPPNRPGDSLPDSRIRPEYKDSGRPL
tara:strand:- start:31399 stop:32406 length:1008 start_codon:yes stop_codon:yes gene_type:complete